MSKLLEVFTEHQRIMMPDVEIMTDESSYVYIPLRGWSSLLAVFNVNDVCIGWINTETLGDYRNARDWINKTKWVDKGY